MVTRDELLAGLPALADEGSMSRGGCSAPGVPLPPSEIEGRLACLDPDMERQDWVTVAGALHATPCTDASAPRALFTEWSRGGQKYDSGADCEAAFDTMPPKPGGVGAGTFIRMTNSAGYRGPAAGQPSESAREVFRGLPAVRRAIAQSAADQAPELPARASVVVLRDETMQDNRPSITPLVEGFLADGGTVGVHGAFNTFKSFMLTDVVLSVSAGVPCFGKLGVRRSGPVVYMAGEGLSGFETQRRPAWRKAREIEAGRVLPAYTVEGCPPVRSADDVALYFRALDGLREPPVVIAIDTVARAMSGLNENDAGDAGRYLDMVEAMARRYGATVISMLHEGKDDSRGARGSSAFSAGFDAVWRMEASTSALTARLSPVKLKDDAGIEPIHLRGRQVDLPGTKGSLVFDWVPADDYRRASGKAGGLQRSDVDQALQTLGAVDGQTVPTRVLATELAGHGADEALVRANERSLQRNAANRFAGYVAHLTGGRGDPTLWTIAVDGRRASAR